MEGPPEPIRTDFGVIAGVDMPPSAPDTAPGEPINDDSRTIPASPRLALVAALAEAVKAASLVGDLRTAQVASRTLHELLGAPPEGDHGAVVDLVSVKERSPR